MKFQELMDCYHISDVDNNQIAYQELLTMMQRKNITL